MKRFGLLVLLLSLVLLVAACSEEENKTEISFFADFPTTVSEQVESIVVEGIEGSTAEDFSIQFYPMYHEKIYAELAGKYGDIYIIRQGAIEGILDPVSFVPLDDVVPPDSLSDEFTEPDPDTGEERTYVVPIENESRLLRELGVTLDTPLAAFIPGFSDSQEESVELLKYLTETK
ncbi:hypothetical protein NC661_18325 [Aquibacillus koreensis]|uniref:Uncharacterized protein n=2 Tax=Aquibacillus koreensis TaxID=279446 RepID=A0A9X3WRD3_9BACI|nr:hypothetical protein [Aquibacillus koreensis]MCT2537035.1 hypothetical protein [Aquibacillus koreensis]MDC3422311.1 hypothetical protein [Aquibacillus koreensis]